jgi:hypothetical protein
MSPRSNLNGNSSFKPIEQPKNRTVDTSEPKDVPIQIDKLTQRRLPLPSSPPPIQEEPPWRELSSGKDISSSHKITPLAPLTPLTPSASAPQLSRSSPHLPTTASPPFSTPLTRAASSSKMAKSSEAPVSPDVEIQQARNKIDNVEDTGAKIRLIRSSCDKLFSDIELFLSIVLKELDRVAEAENTPGIVVIAKAVKVIKKV